MTPYKHKFKKNHHIYILLSKYAIYIIVSNH